jgi:hypothetical protein
LRRDNGSTGGEPPQKSWTQWAAEFNGNTMPLHDLMSDVSSTTDSEKLKGFVLSALPAYFLKVAPSQPLADVIVKATLMTDLFRLPPEKFVSLIQTLNWANSSASGEEVVGRVLEHFFQIPPATGIYDGVARPPHG